MPLRALTLALLVLSTHRTLSAADDPVIHMLVPGFTVRELPVELTNINNLEYAPDGRLFAVGYDGRIHILTDTDGDGLEDAAKSSGSRPTTSAPRRHGHRAEGTLRRLQGPDHAAPGHRQRRPADREESSSPAGRTTFRRRRRPRRRHRQGQQPLLRPRLHDFTNPLQLDKNGKARVRTQQETGTIMKVSPDRKTREIVATGIRFSVGLAFNRHGDLFVTDQEGETWVPNGNPLDELLTSARPALRLSRPHPGSTSRTSSTSRPSSTSARSTSPPAAWLQRSRPHRNLRPRVLGRRRDRLRRVARKTLACSARENPGRLRRPPILIARWHAHIDALSHPTATWSSAATPARPTGAPVRRARARSSRSPTPNRAARAAGRTSRPVPIEVRVAFDRELPPTADEVLSKLAGTQIDYGDFVPAPPIVLRT